MLPGADFHTVDGDGRADNGKSPAQALRDFSLHARAKSEWRDHDAGCIEVTEIGIGDAAVDPQGVRAKLPQRVRGLGSNHVKAHTGKVRAHERQHLARKPQYPIRVRGMGEVTDEDQISTAGKGWNGRRDLVDGPDHDGVADPVLPCEQLRFRLPLTTM